MLFCGNGSFTAQKSSKFLNCFSFVLFTFLQYFYLSQMKPPSPKSLADLLRNYILRTGKDWQQAAKLYDSRVAFRADFIPDFLIGSCTQHKRILDLYLHWREAAGLGPERDMLAGKEDGDRDTPLREPLPYVVLVHNLRSAFNVGSIFRTADCFGFSEVNLSGYTPDIMHPALKSAARGCETWVKSRRWESPIDCINFYKEQNYQIIALETGGESINSFKWPQKFLLVLGNEELGIAKELLDLCDGKVSIQMRGRKASLNVSCAFAVAAAISH
jgi:tRNA(Leu) C34 or U34 (ribose-2'-O)-methylase TrmL